MPPRIKYIEAKSGGVSGPGRIGRVAFSRTGRSVYYAGRTFQSLKGRGFKANYFDAATGEEYWISGCKRRGGDRLYGGTIEIDDDAREEYWLTIRGMPEGRKKGSLLIIISSDPFYTPAERETPRGQKLPRRPADGRRHSPPIIPSNHCR